MLGMDEGTEEGMTGQRGITALAIQARQGGMSLSNCCSKAKHVTQAVAVPSTPSTIDSLAVFTHWGTQPWYQITVTQAHAYGQSRH